LRWSVLKFWPELVVILDEDGCAGRVPSTAGAATAMPLHSKFAGFLLTLSLCLSSIASADESPADLPGAKIASAEQTKRMLDSGVPVVDTRVGNEFAESHVKGAINVPYKERSAKARDFDAAQDSFDLAKLPADKGKAVVFYCNAGECWKSYKASTVALRAGYREVYWFRGGLPEWKRMGFPVE